jgi:ABC-type Fe3+-hydroxamate transport system substrate-binding protein
MPQYRDQLDNLILIHGMPKRIISLVPSQTELLYYLGLDDQVAGITQFCVHPPKWRQKVKVGGTKKLNVELIFKLHPDLIIANKEENQKEQVELLSKHFPVWISDINDLDDALDMIKAIGELTGTSEKAVSLCSGIETLFTGLTSHFCICAPRLKTAYLIWRNPYMAAGSHTFIHSMMNYCHFENIFEYRSRYPVTSIEELKEFGCQLLLLSSEPFPFSEKHVKELEKELSGVKIMLVDGEMFSWYGSRLLSSPGYFKQLVKEIMETPPG